MTLPNMYNTDSPLTLDYSIEDDEVVRYMVSFVHSKTEENMRAKRLERVGK